VVVSLLDHKKQAEHFVAEACMHCLAPTYYETKKHHLAERVSSARFIANVLDLAHDRCIKQAQAILSKIDDISAEDLENAYRSTHSIYVHTSPRSESSLLDHKKQAEHFVAEACMHCLAPTYYETKKHHLAERVSCTALRQLIMRPKSTTWPKECQCTALWHGPVPALIMRETIQSSRTLKIW
jgi:Zn-finger protein